MESEAKSGLDSVSGAEQHAQDAIERHKLDELAKKVLDDGAPIGGALPIVKTDTATLTEMRNDCSTLPAH